VALSRRITSGHGAAAQRDGSRWGIARPFHRPEQKALQEPRTAEFPLLLVTGRTLYAYNAGTMTDQTRNIELRPIDTLDLHPDDAERLGIEDGDTLRIVSAWGEKRSYPRGARHARQEGRGVSPRSTRPPRT